MTVVVVTTKVVPSVVTWRVNNSVVSNAVVPVFDVVVVDVVVDETVEVLVMVSMLAGAGVLTPQIPLLPIAASEI